VHGALLSALGQGDSLVSSSAAVGFEQSADEVTVRLSGGRTHAGDVLVGADGVGSVIRRQLHPDEPPPRPSGYCALRGVVHNGDPFFGSLSGVLYLDSGIESAVVRAGPQSAYWYVSLMATDVGADRPDARTILRNCAPRLDRTFQRVAEATLDADLRYDDLFDRDPILTWGMGRVTLLGDAAHPMLPHTGQGAAQAMEDAVALGLALEPGGELLASLRRYEQIRSARTRAFVRLGRRIVRVSTTRNAVISAVRSFAVRVAPTGLIVASLQAAGRRDPHALLRRREDVSDGS
jgi:2-polyprenyl-6-methoxyphenol hydroxylase-like FAD-dependent oxidoreductase